jgi:hypothetical protein
MHERKKKNGRKKVTTKEEEQQPTFKIEGRELEESQQFQY